MPSKNSPNSANESLRKHRRISLKAAPRLPSRSASDTMCSVLLSTQRALIRQIYHVANEGGRIDRRSAAKATPRPEFVSIKTNDCKTRRVAKKPAMQGLLVCSE